MQVKRITKNNISTFEKLFVPEVAGEIKKGMPVTALGVFSEGVGFGALAGTMSDENIFTIESLYVAPSYRRQGGGTLLLDCLNDLLVPFESRIEINYVETHDEQKTLEPFLKINGYQFDANIQYPYFMTSLGEILDSEYMMKDININQQIVPFKSLTSTQLKAAAAEAEEKGSPIPDGGLTSGRIDRDVSCAILIDNKVAAFIAIEKVDDSLLDIVAADAGGLGSKNVIALFQNAAYNAEEKYTRHINVAACAATDESEKILDKLFDGKEVTRKLYWYATPLFDSFDIDEFESRTEEAESRDMVYLSDLTDEDFEDIEDDEA